ncbi:MAG: hypothetical protein J07HQX50_00203 [Haloquadratum sp. J07HQX50]|jgi:hypothetical protein|nr:MAG: hypothetical protein J07HQX50_00203 [Haloquadratum sp. J07HQX50]
MSVIEQFTTALDLQIEFSHEQFASQTAQSKHNIIQLTRHSIDTHHDTQDFDVRRTTCPEPFLT